MNKIILIIITFLFIRSNTVIYCADDNTAIIFFIFQHNRIAFFKPQQNSSTLKAFVTTKAEAESIITNDQAVKHVLTIDQDKHKKNINHYYFIPIKAFVPGKNIEDAEKALKRGQIVFVPLKDIQNSQNITEKSTDGNGSDILTNYTIDNDTFNGLTAYLNQNLINALHDYAEATKKLADALHPIK